MTLYSNYYPCPACSAECSTFTNLILHIRYVAYSKYDVKFAEIHRPYWFQVQLAGKYD